MLGKLYIVATPIGNLEDITLRAINVLKTVDYIAAEDTRNTLKLLNHYQINKKLISYHRHNEQTKTQELLKLLQDGKNIALVSDAGTPCISDPGEEIVKIAIENNIEIIPIPGACAFINALISSGLDCKEFTFIGFLPLNKKTRQEKLEMIKEERKTIILYEAPHKLKNTLEDLKEILEKRQIVLAKEITKIHETYIRGQVDEVLEKIGEPKGEYVILIQKNEAKKESKEDILSKLPIEEQYKYYEELGFSKKEIIKKIAQDKNVPKNEIYKEFIKE